jgi:hypothetical protein
MKAGSLFRLGIANRLMIAAGLIAIIWFAIAGVVLQ